MEHQRKAIISEDGRSIELYDAGERYIVALGFNLWDWIDLIKHSPYWRAVYAKKGGGK